MGLSARGLAAIGLGAIGLGAAALAGCSGMPMVKHNPALATGAAHCETLQFPIYFQSGSDALTDPAKQAIHASAGQTKGCHVAQVRVLGLADADGSAQTNLELSKRRATVVASALAADGLTGATFDIEAAGAAGATTAKGAAAPVRRRTEVVVTFTP